MYHTGNLALFIVFHNINVRRNFDGLLRSKILKREVRMRERLVALTTFIKVSLMLSLIMGLVLINGCAKKVVKKGAKVKVHYTGRLVDGTIFDSSKERKPLEFTVGSGQMIPGFDKAVEGMKLYEEKTVTIKAEDAYGKRDRTLIREFSLTSLPQNVEPKMGMVIQIQDQNGSPMQGTIIDITENSVIIDLNHPLAGKDLIFDIKVVGIE